MFLQISLADPEFAANLLDPGLILSDRNEATVLMYIRPAVAHAGSQQLIAGLKRGDQRGTHTFETDIGRSGAQNPPVRLFKCPTQGVGGGASVPADDLAHGFGGQL